MPDYHVEGMYLNKGLADPFLEMISADSQEEALKIATKMVGGKRFWLKGPRVVPPTDPDYLDKIGYPRLPGF
ncbi:MAG: hypothetical protein JXB38_07990 [Anaerolineales bacterium]|nr:hypothetical protein [Anaerolineales bacterium]